MVRLLLAQIDDRGPVDRPTVILAPDLVVREST
jgi:hypothetical protein